MSPWPPGGTLRFPPLKFTSSLNKIWFKRRRGIARATSSYWPWSSCRELVSKGQRNWDLIIGAFIESELAQIPMKMRWQFRTYKLRKETMRLMKTGDPMNIDDNNVQATLDPLQELTGTIGLWNLMRILVSKGHWSFIFNLVKMTFWWFGVILSYKWCK